MSSPRQALTAFTYDNPELARLESLLTRFNLFEAVGVVRHELRHSDFLAYLLDPSRSHGLGSLFLREFLQAVQLTSGAESALALLDLDALDFRQSFVLREWHYVDILVVDSANQLAVIIENKIGTSEHSDQLNRYYTNFARHYPGYNPIALYLTPDGDEPRNSPDYQAVSYTLVCEVIEKIAQNNRAAIDSEVVIVLEHYAQMLKRHILSDTEVAELCRNIYQQHKQALDLIFEHRPDQQVQIYQYVKSLVQQETDLKIGGNGKNGIVFSLHEWQNSPRHGGEVGENICWLLYFEFINKTDSLTLALKVIPGDLLEREKHLQMAQKYKFRGFSTRLNRGYSVISSVLFLTESDYEKPQEEIEAIIFEKWLEYRHDEMPRIVEAVRNEKWLWELP